ncbi:MAG: DUF5979 domain-containing protein [Actinomycetes bacterium]
MGTKSVFRRVSGGTTSAGRMWKSVAVASVAALTMGVITASPVMAAPAQLSLTKSASLSAIAPGQQFQYTLLAACSGLTDGCVNATISDTLPAEFEVTSLPQSTSERTVTYDAATRLLTIEFTIALNQPAGKFGLPAGLSRSIQLGMRLPAETPATNNEVIPNTARLTGVSSTGAALTPASATANITAQIPVVVRPVATKSWSPSTAIAQSGATSIVNLGVRNGSSTSADVRRLTVADGNYPGGSQSTFENFNVTSLGPVLSYPPGTDRVTIGVCTVVTSGGCTGSAPSTRFTSAQSGTGPFSPPTGISLSAITFVSFTFTSSTGAKIPYSATSGHVDFGLELRDTARSTGLPIQPQTPSRVTNTAVPTATHNLGAVTTGSPVNYNFTIQPDTITVGLTKEMYADNAGTFTRNGDVVLGYDSGLSMRLTAKNQSAAPVRTLTITEPSPTAANSEFSKIDTTNGRFTWPTGASTAILTVVCRSGTIYPPDTTFPRTGSPATVLISDFGCDGGVAPAKIQITFLGRDVDGNGTIASNASTTLDLHGTAAGVDSTDVGNGLTNCAQADATTPVSSSAVALACATVTVNNPAPGIGSRSKSSAGVQTIVPGQDMPFTVGFKNTGNVPASNTFITDAPDPTANPNPFDVVQLTKIATSATPASVIELYDPQVSAYVAYFAPNAALLARAKGFRVRLLDPLPVGASFNVNYSVAVRTGVPMGATFDNCAQFGVDGDISGAPVCSGTVTVMDPASSASLDKLLSNYNLVQPEPGLPAQTTQVKHRMQNDGPLNLKRLQFTDVDADFFDAVNFSGNMRVNFPPGSNRVTVDVCTTGCHATPAVWIAGTATASATPGLPAGVIAAVVQGIRVTFTSTVSGYPLIPTTNYPTTGNCRNATFCFDVTVREKLRSNANTPVPSTIVDTSSGLGESILQTPGSSFPLPPVSATLTLTPGSAVLKFTKGPESRIAGGDLAPFDLMIENTGTTAIVNPRIIDPIPSELTLESNAPGGAPGRPFVISYPALPTGYATLASSAVAYTETVVGNKTTQVAWTFTGWTLPPGGKVSIRVYVKLTPGTPADQIITNTAGASGSNSGLACDATNTVTSTTTPYGPSLYCLSSAIITSLSGNNVDASKWSSGVASLGYYLTTVGETVSTTDSRCPSYVLAGVHYTRYPCAAIVPPGGVIKYLATLVNAGTDPIDHAVIVDGLPVQGDTGVLLSGSDRGTEWTNRPTMRTAVTPVEAYSGIATGYTNDAFPGFCTANLQPAPSDTCPVGSFTDAFGSANTGFRTALNFPSSGRLLPGQSVTLTWTMTAPKMETTTSESPVAWNSFAQKSTFYNASTGLSELLATEPPKAGVAMRFNALDVTKSVTGSIPSGAATTYDIAWKCVVGGTTISTGTLTIAAGETSRLPYQPVGATCYVWEVTTDGGDSPNQGEVNAAVVVVPDPGALSTVPLVRITNSFQTGRLVISKVVSGAGASTALKSGGTLGAQTFAMSVDCVYPPGIGTQSTAGFPLAFKLTAGHSVTIDAAHGTPVPAGALCTLTETDAKGAGTTTIATNSGTFDEGTTAEILVRSSTAGGTIVDVTNDFTTGRLIVAKKVSGTPPANTSFPFLVSCTVDGVGALADQSFRLLPNQQKALAVPSGAHCRVRESSSGGGVATYSDSDGSHDGTVSIVAGATSSVTVRNTFSTACSVNPTARAASKPVKINGMTVLTASATTSTSCGFVVTPAAGQVSAVRCYTGRSPFSAAADVRFCTATITASGRVVVTTYGYTGVTVELTLVSAPKPGVSGYRVGTWTRKWKVA